MSTIKVNNIQSRTGSAISFTSGDTINIPSGATFTNNGSASGFGKFETQLLHVQDQKANGTAGGDFNSGYQTRTLNTIVTNEITGASLSSNQITLPAGTYYIEGSCPAYQVQRHRCKLRNNTDSSDILFGTPDYCGNADSVSNRSFISGRFTLASSKVVIIQHYAQVTKSGFGFGVDASSGDIEIYADIKIWKVA